MKDDEKVPQRAPKKLGRLKAWLNSMNVSQITISWRSIEAKGLPAVLVAVFLLLYFLR